MPILLLSSLAWAADLTAEASLQAYPHDLAGGAAFRLERDGGAFLSAEARSLVEGEWIGRATAGFDLFGGSDGFDLTLGLFLGSTGQWWEPSVRAHPTAGFELGIGFECGALRGRYRHADGFRGPLEYRLTENEWRLGFAVFDTVEIWCERFGVGFGSAPLTLA